MYKKIVAIALFLVFSACSIAISPVQSALKEKKMYEGNKRSITLAPGANTAIMPIRDFKSRSGEFVRLQLMGGWRTVAPLIQDQVVCNLTDLVGAAAIGGGILTPGHIYDIPIERSAGLAGGEPVTQIFFQTAGLNNQFNVTILILDLP